MLQIVDPLRHEARVPHGELSHRRVHVAFPCIVKVLGDGTDGLLQTVDFETGRGFFLLISFEHLVAARSI